jgi:hypothetical protein
MGFIMSNAEYMKKCLEPDAEDISYFVSVKKPVT